jgi:hypothetical protein
MEIEGIEMLPAHMRDAVRLYVLNGIRGGRFLAAVMTNNFADAVLRADDVNAAALRYWAMWLRDYAPTGCWGSPDRVAAWIKSGGLIGLGEGVGA